MVAHVAPPAPPVPRAGTVASVRVENLMCHENLEVALGPDVNILTGENGSGKSAVLTALCLCLGFTAKMTNRAEHVRDLIRATGGNRAPKAVAAVTLHNGGEDAYRPEVFGPSIVVERHISEGGGMSLRLLGHAGALVSRDKAELARLLDHFNLEVRNRCVVMTQDDTRKCIISGGEEEAFRMFMGATLLENVGDGLARVAGNIRDMHEEVRLQAIDTRRLEQDATVLKNQVMDLELAAGFYTQSEELRKELAWSQVFDCHAAVDAAEERLGLLHKADGPSSLRSAEQVAKSARRARDKAIEEESDRARDAGGLEAELDGLQEALDAARSRLKAATRKVEGARRDMAQVEAREKDMQERAVQGAELENADYLAALTGDVTRLEESVAEGRRKLEELRGEEAAASGGVASAVAARRRADEELHKHGAVERAIARKNADVAQARKKAAAQDSRRFGRFVPELLELVRARGGEFHAPPLGPVGALLAVEDEAWAAAAEVALKSVLESFMVTDMHDLTLLRALAKQCSASWSPTIIVRKFGGGLYDIPASKRPQCGHPAMDSVLRVREDFPLARGHPLGPKGVVPLVLNLLVDLAQVDQLALVPDYEAGKRAVWGRGARATACILPDGTRLTRKGGSESKLDPPRLIVPRLGRGAGQVQPAIDAEATRIRAEEEKAAAARTTLARLAAAARAEEGAARERARAAEDGVRRAGARVGELEEEHEEAARTAAEEREKVTALSLALASEAYSEEAEGIAEERARATAATDAAAGEHGLVAEAEAACAARLDQAKRGGEEKLRDLAEAREERETSERELRHHEEKLAGLREEEVELLAAKEREEDRGRELELLAEQVCPEMELPRDREKLYQMGLTTEKLSSQLAHVEERLRKLPSSALEAAQANKGSRARPDVDKIRRRSEKATARYERALEGLENAEAAVVQLKASLRARQEQLEANKMRAALQTANDFNLVMSESGHSGRVEVDYRAQKLTLVVRLASHRAAAREAGGRLEEGEGDMSDIDTGSISMSGTAEGSEGEGAAGGTKRKLEYRGETSQRGRNLRRWVDPAPAPATRGAGGKAGAGLVLPRVDEVRALETLSGGERSFSTLALALALGGAMETPFRAMDEPDVFMDSVYRESSMELLVGGRAAAHWAGTQLLFITPNEITVKTAPFVKIHRLKSARP